jgi:hypothetical protein
MPHDRHGDQGEALAASVTARRRYDAMLPSSQSIREHSAARLVLEWIILLCLWTIDRFRGARKGRPIHFEAGPKDVCRRQPQ